jgi:lipoprotein NlpD
MILYRVSKLFPSCLALITIALIAGCNTRPADRSYPYGSRALPNAVYGKSYTVKRGDTLYSIAWAIKKDFRTVASWNGIRSPYLIYPGQKLRMYPPKAPAKRATKSTGSSGYAKKSKAPTTRYSSPPPTGRVKRWVWPTISRRVAARYNPSAGREGIDIHGRPGDNVYAAADGQVVYAGSGLRGYGKLIILKHNKTYLSAYAHNENILVAEGQNIRAGHKIGKMGSSSGRAMLHFEIRRNGSPVDPARYIK